MKIDFYDLFSLHTPEEFPEEGTDNYTAAAVKSRVMDNISENKRKPVRISRIGKIFLSAAAAAVVLVTGTLAASALGFIDLEKIFGGMFKSGSENLSDIMSVPQNVIVTGDDSLSFRVLGIAGTETEFVGSIEIKRTDGGVFPQSTLVKTKRYFEDDPYTYYGEYTNDGLLNIIDETTAVYNFKGKVDYSFPDESDSIIGKTYMVDIFGLYDYTEIVKITDKYDVYIDNEDDAAEYYRLLDNETAVLDSGWTITFPLDYTPDYRKVEVDNEPLSGHGISSSVITEVGYSAVTLDVYLDDVYGNLSVYSNDGYNVSVTLENGKIIKVPPYQNGASGEFYTEGGNPGILHFLFEEPVDIDKIESIAIEDVAIPIK